MTKTFPPEVSAAVKDAILKSPGATLCDHLGYLHMWYGVSEVFITTIMAFALGLRNLEKLEYVVRGMDARVKCERLRQAAKKYMPLGPEIEIRLRFFEKKVVPLRNKLPHVGPIWMSRLGAYFLSPWEVLCQIPRNTRGQSQFISTSFSPMLFG